MILLNSNDCSIIDVGKPDFLVEDKIYVRLLQNNDLRKSLLQQVNKDAVIVGRLGSTSDKGFINFEELAKAFDVSTIIDLRKELGYYARI